MATIVYTNGSNFGSRSANETMTGKRAIILLFDNRYIYIILYPTFAAGRRAPSFRLRQMLFDVLIYLRVLLLYVSSSKRNNEIPVSVGCFFFGFTLSSTIPGTYSLDDIVFAATVRRAGDKIPNLQYFSAIASRPEYGCLYIIITLFRFNRKCRILRDDYIPRTFPSFADDSITILLSL